MLFGKLLYFRWFVPKFACTVSSMKDDLEQFSNRARPQKKHHMPVTHLCLDFWQGRYLICAAQRQEIGPSFQQHKLFCHDSLDPCANTTWTCTSVVSRKQAGESPELVAFGGLSVQSLGCTHTLISCCLVFFRHAEQNAPKWPTKGIAGFRGSENCGK